jgi:hypothetical protein
LASGNPSLERLVRCSRVRRTSNLNTTPPRHQNMDILPEDISLGDGLPQLLILLILALCAIYVFARLFTDPEAGLIYHVQGPEQLGDEWEGKVLDEPSLKVKKCLDL